MADTVPGDDAKKITEPEQEKLLLDRAMEILAMEKIRLLVRIPTVAGSSDAVTSTRVTKQPDFVLNKPRLVNEGIRGRNKVVLVERGWCQLDDETDSQFTFLKVRVVFEGEELVQTECSYGDLARGNRREHANGWYSHQLPSVRLSESPGLPYECVTIIILHPVNGGPAFWRRYREALSVLVTSRTRSQRARPVVSPR